MEWLEETFASLDRLVARAVAAVAAHDPVAKVAVDADDPAATAETRKAVQLAHDAICKPRSHRN